jgi:RimJ/RimL family protein N-acetyltransferase
VVVRPFPALSQTRSSSQLERSKPKKNTIEESKDWLVKYILNLGEGGAVDPEIDKFALLLKGEKNKDGELKMVGFVGTNRWCEQGLEVGYCLNIKYWGKGYITEGFRAFLEVFWELSGTPPISLLSPFLLLNIRLMGNLQREKRLTD